MMVNKFLLSLMGGLRCASAKTEKIDVPAAVPGDSRYLL